MPYTTTQLINRSWYLSGVVSRELETVSGDQLNEGLDLLNAVLAVKTATIQLIPYYLQYPFTAIIGQEEYFIPNLLEVETFTFNIGTVRYQTTEQKRRQYFGSGRVDNINSLPYSWHAERCLGGSNLYMYFLPSQAYPCIIWGKFSLAGVTLFQDLSLSMEQFYIEYLRYALAEYICQEYNITFQPQSAIKLAEYEEMIKNISPIDLSLTKISSLQSNATYNYGFVNFSGGWTVPS